MNTRSNYDRSKIIHNISRCQRCNLAACCMQIDPQELRDQTIIFEDKSKFRIKDERYCITTHSTNHNVTCVFNTKKDTPQYKTGKNFSFIRKLEEKFCTFLLHYPLLCICINADIFLYSKCQASWFFNSKEETVWSAGSKADIHRELWRAVS